MIDYFFFNDTATTEIYTLSLHDALPISAKAIYRAMGCRGLSRVDMFLKEDGQVVLNEVNTLPGMTSYSRYPRMIDRKSTRLNSSHANISYAVFCLKKKTSLLSNIKRFA